MHRIDLLNGKVDISKLFSFIEDYVLIKIDDNFPAYSAGSDIDILVFDKRKTIQKIINFYQKFEKNNFELLITDSESHCHIDFMKEGLLDLRIDLINNFDFFTNISIKHSYLVKIFLSRIQKKINDFKIYVPSPENDLTLRYFEYLEWFDRRPDKIKHLDYICDYPDEIVLAKFIEISHQYIQFKRKTWERDVPFSSENLENNKISSIKMALKLIFKSLKYIIILPINHLLKKEKK